MKYGYFDTRNREYVIEKPDTPGAWSNFIGTENYGVIITNNAAGYSFRKTVELERILRFRFNTFAPCMPGRYIYIKDQGNSDYWSASWQPVGKDLMVYKSVCRHGTGYTVISSEYGNLFSETLYYVPLHMLYEVWSFKIKNTGTHTRKISIFSYAEFSNDNNEVQDSLNLQYTQYISRTYFNNNYIVQAINENGSEKGASASAQGSGNETGPGIFRFFTVSGAPVSGWDASREEFIGYYHSYSNPRALERGKCSNSLNYTGNSCASLQIDMQLSPCEQRTVNFILGTGDGEFAASVCKKYCDTSIVLKEIKEIKDYWHSRLNKFQVNTPDAGLNAMVNTWHQYQSYINFFWSRTASLLYRSLRNGYGYRDTMSDIQGIMHLDHKLAGERLRLMLSAQTSGGGGLPLVRFDHNPGSEPVPGTVEYTKRYGYGKFRCDDTLWLFQVLPQYIKESGRIDFLDEVIPYSDKGQDTVYEHLRKAIDFSLGHLGVHNLPLGLESDWNDCLRLGEKGESVFASFQLYLALSVFKELAEKTGKKEDRDWAEGKRKQIFESIRNNCLEENQFVRAFAGNRRIIGSEKNREAAYWLNPQSWSIISGFATKEQAIRVMDTVYNHLNTDYGAMLVFPAIQHTGLPVERMVLYLPGVKENGSIFTQSQSYLVLAETMAGQGNRAWEYYNKSNPAAHNDNAEKRIVEPYVYCQFTEGKESPHYGRSHGHWLTGSSTTMMVSVVEGIFGLQPDYEGIAIDPCIPDSWKEFYMSRVFRDKRLDITVKNPGGVEKGVKQVIVNGDIMNDNFIPLRKLQDVNEIEVIMG
ncbi:MAG: N,N'-diacetylchitobiose phosphorylase [Spirochaetales bacterium]|nr:N,N'-diacetylchitobiose phosphorylase [Spirochaetales bacterium]